MFWNSDTNLKNGKSTYVRGDRVPVSKMGAATVEKMKTDGRLVKTKKETLTPIQRVKIERQEKLAARQEKLDKIDKEEAEKAAKEEAAAAEKKAKEEAAAAEKKAKEEAKKTAESQKAKK